MLIGEYLVKEGHITKEQLRIALDEQAAINQRELLGEIFIRFGFTSRDIITAALSHLDPKALVNNASIDENIPLEYLKQTRTVNMGGSGKYLYIATLDANPREVARHLADLTGRVVELYPASTKTILERLKQEHGQPQHHAEGATSLATDSNINRVLETILRDAQRMRATDIHFEPHEETVHVRFRVDTQLSTTSCLPESQSTRLLARIKDMAEMDTSQKREPQDGSFVFTLDDRSIDFRVATMPSSHGEKLTIRILDREKNLKKLDELGISKLDELKGLLANRDGLILVCGATGSGKTTTLYSIIQYLDRLHRSVNTIEDPIEYRLSFCNQAQVNLLTGFTFSRYTKTILRHDPDVVIVGETRDEDTAANVVNLAETGHLVFTTLHTNDVKATINRLQRLQVNEHHLASLLRGIIVQRLARKLCRCRAKGVKGCPECGHTGYKGMTLLTEFARLTSPDDVCRILAGTFPVHTFAMDAAVKLEQGITDVSEINRVLGQEDTPHSAECVAGGICTCM